MALRAPATRSPFASELKDHPSSFVRECLVAVQTLERQARARVCVVFPFVLWDRTGIPARAGEVYRCQPVERWYTRRNGGDIVHRPGYLDPYGSKLEPVLFAPGFRRIAHESRPLLITRDCEIRRSPIDRHHHLLASSVATERLSGFALVFISRAAPAP